MRELVLCLLLTGVLARFSRWIQVKAVSAKTGENLQDAIGELLAEKSKQ